MTGWSNGRKFFFDSRVYTIIDTMGRGGEERYLRIAGDFLAGGARVLQLRAKEENSQALFDIASQIRTMTDRAGATFIMNDRADIALASAADGIHLGQDDLPLGAARKIVGWRMIIGISTHSEEQAIAAEEQGADYIGFGPIFPTATKQAPYQPQGLDKLMKVRSRVRLPIVVIGGITEGNFSDVLAAGADAAALISDLVLSENRTGKVARLLRLASTGS